MKKAIKVYSVQFRKHPFWLRTLNNAWRLSYFAGTRARLDKDHLIRSARRKTGLQNLGSEFPEEALDRLLLSIREEARLHPIGRFITQQRLINLLSVRLRVEEHYRKKPEIFEQELYPVMLIIGLQRTGTTKLHRLLAADPDNRSLASWEALNPVPVEGEKRAGIRRKKIARISEHAVRYMSRGFFAIHPIEYQAPEEDVLLLDVSFMSTTAEATMHVPSYAAWLEETDQSAAYDYMVKLLKLLQWQRPAKRWVLKTPHHMEFLDLAQKYFGRVHFIWTHRDIYQSIPSYLSMITHSRSLFSNSVNPNEVAQHWVRKNGLMLKKALNFKENCNGTAQFTDVYYDRLVGDSMAVLKEIYEARGESISETLEKQFRISEQKNPKDKYGRHIYSLGDFGIDRKYIDLFTSRYRDFHNEITINSK